MLQFIRQIKRIGESEASGQQPDSQQNQDFLSDKPIHRHTGYLLGEGSVKQRGKWWSGARRSARLQVRGLLIWSGRRSGETAGRFSIGRGNGQRIEPLGLSDFKAAIRADKVAREIPFGVLLEHEMTAMSTIYACHSYNDNLVKRIRPSSINPRISLRLPG